MDNKKYTSEESAELREEAIREWILPSVRAGFDDNVELQSATLWVAQYWDDEASDAVHPELLFSTLESPDLEAMRTQAMSDSSSDADLDWEFADDGRYWRAWESNHKAVSLFAAFTVGGAHQDLRRLEAYSPYAIFRRDGADIKIDVVGKMLRPWLDGIASEWG